MERRPVTSARSPHPRRKRPSSRKVPFMYAAYSAVSTIMVVLSLLVLVALLILVR